MNCDYDTSRGYNASEGLGCYKGEATNRVVITYTPSTETDTLNLCDECLRTLRKLARRHRYKIQAEKLQTDEQLKKEFTTLYLAELNDFVDTSLSTLKFRNRRLAEIEEEATKKEA